MKGASRLLAAVAALALGLADAARVSATPIVGNRSDVVRSGHGQEALIGGRGHALRAAGRVGASQELEEKKSLQDSSEKLENLLSAAEEKQTEVDDILDQTLDTCNDKYSEGAERMQGHETVNEELGTLQIQKAAIQAGLAAELERVEKSESDTQLSYNSSVNQRADLKQNYMHESGQREAQGKVLGEVVEKLKERQMVAAEPPKEKTMAAGYQSTSLNYVVGIFGNMLDTNKAETVSEDKDYKTSDGDLVKLVESYKVALQELDQEYQTKNAARLKAFLAQTDAAKESTLRKTFVDYQTKISDIQFELCAGGGKLTRRKERGTKEMAQLQNQVEQARTKMEDMPELGAAAAFVAQPRAIKTTAKNPSSPIFVQSPSSPDDKVKRLHEKAVAARAEVLKMATDAAERMSPGSTRHLNATLGGKIPRRAHNLAVAPPGSSIVAKLQAKERRKHDQEQKLAAVYALLKTAEDTHDETLKALAQSIPRLDTATDIANLAAFSNRLSAAGDKNLTKLADECADKKLGLTTQIIASRRASRVIRGDIATAKAREAVSVRMVDLVKIEKDAFVSEEDAQTEKWMAISPVVGSLNGALGEFDEGLKEVEADAEAYVADPTAPPAASGIPNTLAAVRKTLVSLQDTSNGYSKLMINDFINLKVLYSSVKEELDTKVEELAKEEKEAAEKVKESETALKDSEDSTEKLMGKRKEVEEECEAELVLLHVASKRVQVEVATVDLAESMLGGTPGKTII